MKILWRVMEDSFIKTCNKTYDRLVHFSSKQHRGESIENFYGRLEQAENCSLGDEKTTLTLIANMLEYEKQKELKKRCRQLKH